MPNNMVIDLSHNNGDVDFSQLAGAGVYGVIHKATQHTNFTDPMYAERRNETKAAGLKWGAYHFASAADVDAQVEFFLNFAQPDADTLVALDFEPNTTSNEGTMSLAQAKQFLQAIEQKLGRKAVFYSGSLINQALGGTVDSYLAEHRLWWAQYANAPVIQASWPTYWLWQFTDGASGPLARSVAGVHGPCDCDSYQGTPAQLAADWAS